MYSTSSYAVILQETAPVLPSVATGAPGNLCCQTCACAATATDARKPPVIQDFGPVYSDLRLPLKRHSG